MSEPTGILKRYIDDLAVTKAEIVVWQEQMRLTAAELLKQWHEEGLPDEL
jgi:hypothetical protein